jgi:hypothetical protein
VTTTIPKIELTTATSVGCLEVVALHAIFVIVNLEFKLITHLVISLSVGLAIGVLVCIPYDVFIEELEDIKVAGDFLINLSLHMLLIFLGIPSCDLGLPLGCS